jgi:endonuclease/exonuclease/phosphatase family metal-dependent hydrolase
MKFLQWNIWYKEKADNIVDLIKKLDPDVICLQELAIGPQDNPGISDVAQYIAEKTGLHYYFEEAQRWRGDDEMDAIGNGIFTKYPITRRYAKHVQVPTEDFTDYAHEGRIYIECDVEINGRTITVGTAHLSYTHRFEITDEKKTEVDNLLAIVAKHKQNFIFSGDLNSEPTSYTIRELSKLLHSYGPDFSQNTWTTKPFEHQGFKASTLDWRLDYVFATEDIKCNSAEIIHTDYSDHLPILVNVEL